MKPEYPTNGAAPSHKKSSKEECSSKTNNEECNGFSSEFLTKINNFFEIHNSFLYEDVHENTSDLEKSLSANPTSDGSINGNCSNEDETVEDEKSYSADSQKIYSSLKRYSLRNVKETPDLPSEGENINIQNAKKSLRNHHLSPFEIVKIPAIPDSFQLPISNETQNTATFDTFISENNFIDIKFPTYKSSSKSQNLTKAQRSVRLNKKSNLRKIIKKSTYDKLTVPYKTKECPSPKQIISRDVTEKIELENTTPALHSSLSTHCDLSENEEQKKYLHLLQSAYHSNPRIVLPDILENCQDFKKQLKNETEALCVEKTVFKFSIRYEKKLQSEVKTVSENNVGNTSKKVLNSGRNLKKNKSLLSEVKNNLNETNDCVKTKDKAFTPDKKNSFANQSKLSKESTNIVEKKLSKKNKFRISNHLAEEPVDEVSLKKKATSRKKPVPQNITKIEAKFEKKNTPKKKAVLKKGDNVEDTDLPVNEIGSDLFSNKVTANKSLDTKIKAKKNASKKKGAFENEAILDGNKIIEDATLHAKESRSNLRKDDIVAAVKNRNAKIEIKKSTRKKKAALENDEDNFNKNKIVVNKNLNAKIEIKKSTRKKKAALENNEDNLNKNKIVVNANLSVNEIGKDLKNNEIVAADKNLNTKIKFNKKNTTKKKTALENKNLSVKEISSGSVKNKSDEQNTSNTALPETPQRLSSSFIQLFNKVTQSHNSEAFSNCNNSFARLFQQHSYSRLTASGKITKASNQKQDEEQLLQPNSSKGNNINLADLKSSKAAKEKSVKTVPLGKKRSSEEHAEGTPLKKKKQNHDPVKINSEKNLNSEISFNEDSDRHYNDKTTKTNKKQLVQSIGSKPSLRSSKRNKKLDKESNVTADLCNKKKGRTAKKMIEDVESFAKPHSSCNSVNVIPTTSVRSSRTKKSTTIKSADAHSSHETKEKAASLLSTESESLYNDGNFDACSFIKVVEVKSLAHLNKAKNTNPRKKKSNNFISDSFSEDSKTMEKCEQQLQLPDSEPKNRRKNKRLHLSKDEKSWVTQSEQNTSLELNSDDRLTQTKRKRRSTAVDPNFFYEVKTPRIQKEDKPFSAHQNSIKSSIVQESPSKCLRCQERDFINKMSSADTTQEESANEHGVQIYNNGRQVCNLNSNGTPLNSLNSEQLTEFISSYTSYPINEQCFILYNPQINSAMLSVPTQSQLNLNLQTLMPQSYPVQSFPISSFISSRRSPMISTRTLKSIRVQKKNFTSCTNSHPATSVVSDQNVSPVLATQTVSSSENASATSSNRIYYDSCSNSFGNNHLSVGMNASNSAQVVESFQTPSSVRHKPQSELCLRWPLILERSFKLVELEMVAIEKLAKDYFGKNLADCSVREFCSIPEVEKALSKPEIPNILIEGEEDQGIINYCFNDSILDEPFTHILRDVTIFFLQCVSAKVLDETGEDLKRIFCNAIYSKFSVTVATFFSVFMPISVKDLTYERMIGIFTVICMLYIYKHFKDLK